MVHHHFPMKWRYLESGDIPSFPDTLIYWDPRETASLISQFWQLNGFNFCILKSCMAQSRSRLGPAKDNLSQRKCNYLAPGRLPEPRFQPVKFGVVLMGKSSRMGINGNIAGNSVYLEVVFQIDPYQPIDCWIPPTSEVARITSKATRWPPSKGRKSAPGPIFLRGKARPMALPCCRWSQVWDPSWGLFEGMVSGGFRGSLSIQNKIHFL